MRQPALTVEERSEVWRLYRAGVSLRAISRLLGRSSTVARALVATTGGLQPGVRRRSALRLSLAEREEISRGLVASESCRSIARRLRRAPSTVSREIAGNGGRHRYRAAGGRRGCGLTSVPTQAGEARHPRAPVAHRRGEARVTLVTAADQWLAASRVRWLPGAVRVPRDDLHVALRPITRGAEARAHPLSALRTHDAPPARDPPPPRTRTAARDAAHQRASARGGGPRVPGHWEGDLLLGGATARSKCGRGDRI